LGIIGNAKEALSRSFGQRIFIGCDIIDELSLSKTNGQWRKGG
jgi:hypothetical protein